MTMEKVDETSTNYTTLTKLFVLRNRCSLGFFVFFIIHIIRFFYNGPVTVKNGSNTNSVANN